MLYGRRDSRRRYRGRVSGSALASPASDRTTGTPECFAGGRALGCGAAGRTPGKTHRSPARKHDGTVSRGRGHRSGGVGVQPIGGVWHLVDVGSGGERRPGEYGGGVHRGRGRGRTAFLLCGDWHTAEDLTQTTLARVFVSWQRISRQDAVYGYASRTLVNAF